VLELPRVQVLSRDLGYVPARAKAVQAIEALDWLINTTVGGTKYHHVQALQRPPFLLQIDTNNRFVFATNFQVTKQAGP
jgi:hypothetical protein